MVIWITFAVLTAVVLALLWLPFGRRKSEGVADAVYDLNVYRDQLSELERDEAAGLIAPSEAQGARNEIARRMLAAEQALSHGQRQKDAHGKWTAVLPAVAIPLVALGGYLVYGSPEYRDVPRAERIANAAQTNDFPALVVQVEQHLAKNPDDVEGWLVLAPAYRRQGRFDEAAAAFARAARLRPDDPNLHTAHGETLVLAGNGTVTDAARKAFENALQRDPADAKARFYLAMALAQDGKTEQARSAYQVLLDDAPADAPWRPAVERQLAQLDSPAAPGPTGEQVAAAQSMSAEDRQQMIRNMVDGLAERLAQDGNDLDGWLRLINARVVLGDSEKAAAALKSAREQFAANEAALARIAAQAKELGLQ
jgi:cytochrome c-type biogenesis protein CcmH